LTGRKCSPPFGENALRFTAAMQHGQNLHLIQFDGVKNPVRKTVEIQAPDAGKTNGAEQRALAKFPIGAEKLLAKLDANPGSSSSYQL
jgi:hypothetical protein